MMSEPNHVGHPRRLREPLQRTGADVFHDDELLALLLTYSMAPHDVKPMAKTLLDRFGGLAGVFDASRRELEDMDGIAPSSATLIRLVKEIGCAYLAQGMQQRDALTSPQAVRDFARMRLAGFPYEVFMVLYLNTQNEVVGYEIMQEGTINRAIIYPRRIIEAALQRRAAGLIFVHNHPSHHTEPSEDDKRLTRTMAEAARMMDLRLLDHLVIGKAGYFSFRERALLSEA